MKVSIVGAPLAGKGSLISYLTQLYPGVSEWLPLNEAGDRLWQLTTRLKGKFFHFQTASGSISYPDRVHEHMFKDPDAIVYLISACPSQQQLTFNYFDRLIFPTTQNTKLDGLPWLVLLNKTDINQDPSFLTFLPADWVTR